MTLEELLFDFEQTEAAGNGNMQVSKAFGYLKLDCRNLAIVEDGLLSKITVGICANQDVALLTVSDFVEKIRYFMKEIHNSDALNVTVNGRSILYTTGKDGVIAPVTIRDIDVDKFIEERINEGHNWLKEFFNMGISAKEIPHTPKNYARDYALYVGTRSYLTPYAESISDEQMRQKVFLNAIREFVDEKQP